MTTTRPTMTSDGTAWLAGAYESPGFALSQWAGPEGLAQIPAGRRFDILRITRNSGRRALAELLREGAPVGPVLLCAPRDAVEFLVPVGAAGQWAPLSRTTCVGLGSSLRCPMGHVVEPQLCHGRTWLVAPRGDGVLTDLGLLRRLIEAQRSR